MPSPNTVELQMFLFTEQPLARQFHNCFLKEFMPYTLLACSSLVDVVEK